MLVAATFASEVCRIRHIALARGPLPECQRSAAVFGCAVVLQHVLSHTQTQISGIITRVMPDDSRFESPLNRIDFVFLLGSLLRQTYDTNKINVGSWSVSTRKAIPSQPDDLHCPEPVQLTRYARIRTSG